MKITKTFFVETLEKMWNRKNTELSWKTHFQLLVAIVLSAQTTDIQVNKATKKLFAFMQKPEDLKNISIEKIQESIKTL
jgi:endonuclease-3